MSPVYSMPVTQSPGQIAFPRETKEDALATFRAWMTLPQNSIHQHHYDTPHFHARLTEWVDYVQMYVQSAGINPDVIRHTV
jgi:hypothetical protein